MFEKEAEFYAREKYSPKTDSFIIAVADDAFKDGAEFGYSKGNEWHKIADGDLPENTRYVWTNVGAGYHDDDGWWDDYGRLQGVVAWCEPTYTEKVEE